MSIVLIRHGETEGNAARVLQVADMPLSERGRRQAARLAARIAELGVGQLVSSDLARAHMTALAIAEQTGVAIELSPLLQERSFGDLRGTPYAALAVDPFGPDFAPPGGETWAQFHARVERAFSWLVERAPSVPGNLVVVTHGLVCRALLERHLQFADVAIPERFENTSVTVLDAEAPYRVRLANCIRHLDELEGEAAEARAFGLV